MLIKWHPPERHIGCSVDPAACSVLGIPPKQLSNRALMQPPSTEYSYGFYLDGDSVIQQPLAKSHTIYSQILADVKQ